MGEATLDCLLTDLRRVDEEHRRECEDCADGAGCEFERAVYAVREEVRLQRGRLGTAVAVPQTWEDVGETPDEMPEDRYDEIDE